MASIMVIGDVESILGITIVGTPTEGRYTALMNGAITYVNNECGNRFDVYDTVTNADGTTSQVFKDTEFSDDVKVGIALCVKAMAENPQVASQSLGDMAKSFFQGATYKAAQVYWKRYRRATFV